MLDRRDVQVHRLQIGDRDERERRDLEDVDGFQIRSARAAKLEAPISGRVGAIRVTPGNLVNVNDATGLVTITQIQPIRVAFTLAERDLPAARLVSLLYSRGKEEQMDVPARITSKGQVTIPVEIRERLGVLAARFVGAAPVVEGVTAAGGTGDTG
jgi:multidrug efflux pump subunit AcrA (membrane-fusion protein)